MRPTLRAVVTGEFLGTLLLILLGDGVVASVELLGKESGWVTITTGWALAVTIGVYASARLSGGHINPAVTLAFATRGEVAWGRVPAYWLAQLAGAFAGAALVYFDYSSAFIAFEATHDITRGALENGRLAGPAAGGAGVFCTFPAFDNLIGNVFSEFLGTAVLLFAVRAVTDRRNAGPEANLGPVLVGVTVWAIGLSLGGLTGYAINPARDLGPRLAAAVFGWGASVFESHNNYFWVPIAAPMAGGVFGVWLYDLLVAPNLEPVATKGPGGQPSP